MKTPDIYCHNTTTPLNRRNKINYHGFFLIWITCLSLSSKSNLASTVEKELHGIDFRAYVNNVRNRGTDTYPRLGVMMEWDKILNMHWLVSLIRGFKTINLVNLHHIYITRKIY